MKKLLCLIPFALCGCDTMNDWANDAYDAMPSMSMPSSETGMPRQDQQQLNKTNTNLYTVPQK